MNTHCLRPVRTLSLAMLLSASAGAQQQAGAGAPILPVDLLIAESTEVVGVPDAKDRYHQFREPCLVVTKSGRLVMMAQGRDDSRWSDRSGQDLVSIWSDDGGKTWARPVLAAEHGNQSVCPNALVYDRDADALHGLYNQAHKANGQPQCRQYQITSRDGGATWSKPREITKMFGKAAPA